MLSSLDLKWAVSSLFQPTGLRVLCRSSLSCFLHPHSDNVHIEKISFKWFLITLHSSVIPRRARLFISNWGRMFRTFCLAASAHSRHIMLEWPCSGSLSWPRFPRMPVELMARRISKYSLGRRSSRCSLILFLWGFFCFGETAGASSVCLRNVSLTGIIRARDTFRSN